MAAAGGAVDGVIDIDAADEASADEGDADAALAGAGGGAAGDGAAAPKRRRSVAAWSFDNASQAHAWISNDEKHRIDWTTRKVLWCKLCTTAHEGATNMKNIWKHAASKLHMATVEKIAEAGAKADAAMLGEAAGGGAAAAAAAPRAALSAEEAKKRQLLSCARGRRSWPTR